MIRQTTIGSYAAIWLIALVGIASADAIRPIDQLPSFAPLAARIRDAVHLGAVEVVLPPGIYRSDVPAGSQAHLVIEKAHGVRIVADGVTMICTRLTRAISIKDCEGLTIRGLTLDYDPLPFTQGRVIALTDGGKTIHIQLDKGYPRQAYNRIDVIDPKTRTRKHGMPFLWGAKSQWLDEKAGILCVGHPELYCVAAVGDLVSLSTGPEPGGAPHGITIQNSADTTLRNVTIYSAPGMGIFEVDGEGGAKYIGCKMIPGPPPSGASEARLLSTSWDGILSSVVRRGPLLENCDFRDCGDDSWSMQSADYVILHRQGRTIVVSQRHRYCDGPQVGDRLRTALDAPFAVVVARRRISPKDVKIDPLVSEKLQNTSENGYWALSDQWLELTLDRDLPLEVGQSLYDPDRQGAGFIFRNNQVHSPGRGALIKGGCGLIEGNTFMDVHAAVTITPELPDGAAHGIRGIVIRNNTIRGSGYFCPAPWSSEVGALSISDADGVVVENNLFEDINGLSIGIMSASNVTVRDNAFRDIGQTAPNTTGANDKIDQRALLWINKANRIRLENNRVENAGIFLRSPVSVGTGGVTDFRGQTSGVKIVNASTGTTQPEGSG